MFAYIAPPPPYIASQETCVGKDDKGGGGGRWGRGSREKERAPLPPAEFKLAA